MSSGPVTMNVDQKLVQEIVEKEIVAAVTACFEGRLNIAEQIVRQALAQKVGADGKIDTYGYSGSKTYLEWVCDSAIRQAVKDAVQGWIEKSKPAIQKQVEKHLRVQQQSIAAKMVGALVENASNSCRLNITVEQSKER